MASGGGIKAADPTGTDLVRPPASLELVLPR